MADVNDIVCLGFGSWSSVNSIPTFGFGSSTVITIPGAADLDWGRPLVGWRAYASRKTVFVWNAGAVMAPASVAEVLRRSTTVTDTVLRESPAVADTTMRRPGASDTDVLRRTS